MSKVVEIHIINGAEGRSLSVMGLRGGLRVAGPKAWGNPYNKPMAVFMVDAGELIRAIREHAYLPQEMKETP